MARSATTFSNVCVINKDGNLVDIIPVRAAAVDLLGELWENGAFYVLDQADKIDPRTHQVQTIANGFAFPNGMAEERRGNIYVTDSLLGTIFRFSREDGKVKAWLSDPAPISQNPNQNVGSQRPCHRCRRDDREQAACQCTARALLWRRHGIRRLGAGRRADPLLQRHGDSKLSVLVAPFQGFHLH